MRTSDEQIYSGTVTESGNSYSTPINVKGASEIVLFLDVMAVSGTNPTLIINLMTKDTINNKWFLMRKGDFTSTSNTTAVTQQVDSGLGSYIACNWVVGGQNPRFSFTLNASIKD